METQRFLVYVQRENEKGGMKPQQQCWLAIDADTGTLRIRPYGVRKDEWSLTFRPEHVTSLEVVMVGSGGALSLLFLIGPLPGAIDMLVSRWVRLPALRLEQAGAPDGERVVIVRSAGYEPRKETRALASRIAGLLSERGSKIMLPNLADETPWKYPIVPLLIVIGLVVAFLVAMFTCLAAYR